MSFQLDKGKHLAHHESREASENGENLRDSTATAGHSAPAPALDRYFWEWLDRRIGIFDRRAGSIDAYGGSLSRTLATCRDTYTAEKIVAALNAAVRP